MTLPKRRLPGSAYGVVLRCEGRRFRLAPTPACRRALGYWLAFCAEQHGILLHAFCAMSNHLHLVLTDPRGVLGEFMRDLGAKLAAWLNREQGVSGVVFSRYRDWVLPSKEDLLAHVCYVVLNPVAAGLVPDPRAWPGLISLPAAALSGDTFEQPEALLREGEPDGRYPAAVDLRLLPPLGWSRREFAGHFTASLAFWLLEARRASRGQVYPPLARLVGVDPLSAPRTPDTPPGRPGHLSNPTREEREGLREWRRAYREALDLWRAGEREVAIFPPGTYLHVRWHGARVASP